MRNVSLEQAIDCLKTLQINPGDGLLAHSAIQFLGRPAGGVAMYLDAIRAVIGPDGTLVVPAFNFAFARGEPFHPQETSSEGMGVFSEYVRQHPEALRTTHPMQSLAVIGRYAEALAACDTPAAFDPGSAYERMLELDFKLLLLGAEVHSVSMLHYSEQRACVPYRYWKDFSGQVWTGTNWETCTYRMFVRDLETDPYLRLHLIQELLETRCLWHSINLNYGKLASCRLVDFVAATDEILEEDPWALVENRPK